MISPEEILDLPMQDNDADADTIRDYLKALVREIWREGEGFSGKRPFGNSSWENELAIPLVMAGLVSGTVDEDGCIEFEGNYYDSDLQVRKLIEFAIDAL